MTSEVRAAWTEVADRVEAPALKAKFHADEDLWAASTDVQGGLERLRAAAETTMEATADVGPDPAVRSAR